MYTPAGDGRSVIRSVAGRCRPADYRIVVIPLKGRHSQA